MIQPIEGAMGIQSSATNNPYPLRTIYFYLTEGCNLKCRHCWINPKFQTGELTAPYISKEMFRDIIQQAKPMGLRTVKLTGGEPMIHPNFDELLEILIEEDIVLTMETNALMATPEKAKLIAKSKRPFVSVSLDGAKKETHEWVRGVDDSFEDAIQGVKNLVAEGVRPQIIMTLMKRNKEEILDLVALAESIGAGSVKFNLLQPAERGHGMHEAGDTLSVKEMIEIGDWIENEVADKVNIKLIYSHPPAFQPLSRFYNTNTKNGVCGILGILGVLGDGTYALCGIGQSEKDLVFGHASKDQLQDVWNQDAVLNELRGGLPKKLEGVCSECMMQSVCLGHCIALNYVKSKKLWGAHWYCAEALKLGLFPESRLKRKPEPQLEGTL